MNPTPKKRNVTAWKGVAQKYEMQLCECAAAIGAERQAHDDTRQACRMWQDSYATQVKVASWGGIAAAAMLLVNIALLLAR